MASAVGLAQRTAPFLLLLSLLLVPFAQAYLEQCRSWNVYGARNKLRDYPGMAGPIRTALGNFSACWSLTMNISVASSYYTAPPITRYWVVLDNQPAVVPAGTDPNCTSYMEGIIGEFTRAPPDFWDSLFNANQQTKHDYTFNEAWFQCCNTSMCNGVLNPPTFNFNITPRPIHSCNAFNVAGGYRFFSNPESAGPLMRTTGDFADCFSLTIELTRGEKTMYYVKLDGYDPDKYDGVSSCMTWLNSTLRSYKADDIFPIKFNYTMGAAWGTCCNKTDCNIITLPPSNSSQHLRPSPFSLMLVLLWACMLILCLS